VRHFNLNRNNFTSMDGVVSFYCTLQEEQVQLSFRWVCAKRFPEFVKSKYKPWEHEELRAISEDLFLTYNFLEVAIDCLQSWKFDKNLVLKKNCSPPGFGVPKIRVGGANSVFGTLERLNSFSCLTKPFLISFCKVLVVCPWLWRKCRHTCGR